MKVKCIRNTIDSELVEKYGLSYAPDYYNSLTIGKEYIVLGLAYNPELIEFYAGNPIVEVKDDSGGLTAIPLLMFEITDPTPSKYWVIKVRDTKNLTLYPESFYQKYYHDDLSERVSEVVDDFYKICVAFEEEAESSS